MERWVVVMALAPPCPAWPLSLLPVTSPSSPSPQYCTCCPTLPALVPRANTGGGVRSTHGKATPSLAPMAPRRGPCPSLRSRDWDSCLARAGAWHS